MIQAYSHPLRKRRYRGLYRALLICSFLILLLFVYICIIAINIDVTRCKERNSIPPFVFRILCCHVNLGLQIVNSACVFDSGRAFSS